MASTVETVDENSGMTVNIGVRRVSFWQRKRFHQLAFIVVALLGWEGIAHSGLVPPLLFPSVEAIAEAFASSILSGEILLRAYWSLYLIGSGFAIAMVLGFIATGLCMWSRTINNIIETILSIMHPLPGIALFPVILLWVGTGPGAITLILVHSVLWPTIVNTLAGFKSIPRTQLEVGRVIGLNPFQLFVSVRIPAAFPYIFAGIRISWARSWRSLVAAEMVFGAAGVEAGIGWFIYQHRYLLDTAGVFAGLVMIVIIGILVEEYMLGWLEKRTIQRWGMAASGH